MTFDANDPAWAYAAYAKENPRLLHYSGPTLRTVWADAVRWVLKTQLDWENLTEAEGVAELRKGSASVFFPLFRDDQTLWVDCPNHGRVVIDKEGHCFQCGYDFTRTP